MDPNERDISEYLKLLKKYFALQVKHGIAKAKLVRRTQQLEDAKVNAGKALTEERQMYMQQEYKLRQEIEQLSTLYRNLQKKWLDYNQEMMKLRTENNALRCKLAQLNRAAERRMTEMVTVTPNTVQRIMQQLNNIETLQKEIAKKQDGNINNNVATATASSAFPTRNGGQPKPQKPKRRRICTDDELNRCDDDGIC